MGAKTLSDERVRELRTRRVINGEHISDLAEEFGISPSHTLRICRGEFRVSAGGPLEEYGTRAGYRTDQRGPRNPNWRDDITFEDRELVKKLLRQGGTQRNIAAVMMISRSLVAKISVEMRRERKDAW